MTSGNRSDIIGQVIGMLVFLLGVGLLIAVFFWAFKLFGAKPDEVLDLTFTGDPKKDPTVAVIGSRFGWLLMKIAFLFIMSLAGSMVSQRGINLYFSAIHGTPGSGTHKNPQNPPAPQPPAAG